MALTEPSDCWTLYMRVHVRQSLGLKALNTYCGDPLCGASNAAHVSLPNRRRLMQDPVSSRPSERADGVAIAEFVCISG